MNPDSRRVFKSRIPPRRAVGSPSLWIPAVSVLVLGCAGGKVRRAGAWIERAWPQPANKAEEGRLPETEQDSRPRNLPRGSRKDSGAGDEPISETWSLDQVLTRIKEANPRLSIAEANLEAARAALDEAKAAYRPILSLSRSYLVTDEPGTAFGLLLNQQRLSLGPSFDATPGTIDNHRTEARVDWTLFAPGRLDRKRAAGAAARAAEIARRAAEHRLLNAGVQAWLGLKAADALHRASLDNARIVGERLAELRKRRELGAALEADVLRMEARLALSRRDVEAAKLVRNKAEAALDHLMGLPSTTRIDLGGTAAEEVRRSALPETLEEALARARRTRLDLRARAWLLRSREFEVAGAEATRKPVLSAFGAVDLDGEDFGIDSDLTSYQAGIFLSWTLDPGREARIRRAKSGLRKDLAAFRAFVLDLSKEVRQAWDALELARRNLELARKGERAAVEAWRIVSKAHGAGAATTTDLLAAERSRSAAVLRRTAAETALSIAEIRLLGSMGGIQ